MKEQREESVRTGNGQSSEQLQRYMEAFYSEALLLYDINVTKDLLEEELCGWMDGREIHLLPLVGLAAPCSFTGYVSRWADTAVLPKDRELYRKVFSRDYLLKCAERDDREICVEYSSVAGRTEKVPGIVRQTLRLMKNESGDTIARCVVKDVTAEREKEARLLEELRCVMEENHRLAYVDELTGCPNKKGFLEAVRKSLEQHPEYQYGMCCCDINNLSYVNSIYGYEVGNELLRYWIGCIKEFLGDDEAVGRISGDYFAVFLNMGGVGRRQELEDCWQMIQRKVNRYFKRFDRHFNVVIYSGVYMITPADIASMAFGQMLDRALLAQKNAKETGDNRIAYYNEEQWEKQRRSIEIAQHLTESIRNGEIEAWIQPQYALSEEDVAADGTLIDSGEDQRRRLIGGEVLSRWDSSFLGEISPAEFISVLEARGQIYELDRFIWEQACRYLRRWLDTKGCEVVPLSVNISRRDVMEDDLCSVLYGLLDKYHLTPDLLHLEITESAYVNEPEKLIKIVQELQEYGFTIEMDDFGSGYASLNMLREVPVDTLKMDLRFLKETGSSRKGGNIISSIIGMSQGLNIPVIAEGVEKIEQSDALRNMGCLMMQGYYFAKPMPYDEFGKLLMTQQTGEKISHVVRSRGVNYLVSEAINTTEEHRLPEEANDLTGEMNTQMNLLPAGMLRYEAGGRQEFVRVPGINTFDYDLADDCLMLSMTKRDGHTAKYMLSPYLGELEEKWATKETADTVRALVKKAGCGTVSGTMRYEGRLEKKEYSSFRCYYSSIADDDGRVRRITGIAADIGNEVKEVSGWRERAHRDEMTKLLNHDATIEAIRNHLQAGDGGMLLMLDVDNFKWINDAHGHLFGDEVLKKIAGMLQDQFRRDDVLGRYGGDEFVVFLPGVYDRDFAQRKAEQMRQALGEIIINEGMPVHCSLGIAIDQTGEKSAEELLLEADMLMYGAKSDGKGCCRIG